MFAGIVEEVASVESLTSLSAGKRLAVLSALGHERTALGDSISIEGVCLTVVAKRDQVLEFDVSPETLRRSTLGRLSSGSKVNLERSLEIGSRLGGHFVTGHVDAVASLRGKRSEGESERQEWSVPSDLMSKIASKGSVALAGVSLTVGEVGDDWFSVYLIPHTLSVTTLSSPKVGMQANLEIDLLARYVERVLVGQGRPSQSALGEFAAHYESKY